MAFYERFSNNWNTIALPLQLLSAVPQNDRLHPWTHPLSFFLYFLSPPSPPAVIFLNLRVANPFCVYFNTDTRPTQLLLQCKYGLSM